MRTALGAFVFGLFLFSTSISNAVTPAHFWSLSSGGNNSSSVNSVVIVPSNGDIIATGYFFGTMDLGTGAMLSDTTFSKGVSDGWIARFNRAGQIKWAKRFGSYNGDSGASVGVDAAGNIYLLAGIGGTTNFGGSDVGGFGLQDIALVKLDGNGNHIWSHGYGGGGYDQGTHLAVDASGNVIICGTFPGTANFGGPDLIAVGPSDGFIAKYNSSGVWQWSQPVSGNGDQIVYSLAVDGAANVYATGYFNTEVTFPGFSPLASAGGFDLFIAKYNSAGAIQWTQKRGGTGDDAAIAIAADASGNLAVGGAFHDTMSLGGTSLVSAGGFDGFLARYNTSGVHQWSLRFGSAGDIEAAYGIGMNSSGKVFLSATSEADIGGAPGSGGPDILFAKYSSTGAFTWSRLIGGSGDDRGWALAVDAGDNVVVAGSFEHAVDFGGGNREAHGQDDLFLARYGVAEPAITTIKDIGNDQGRNVRITLARSPLDDGTAALPVTQYQAWRRILPLPVALSSRGSGPRALPSGTWEHVASVPASNLTSYRMVAPTLADSTISFGMYRTKFFVRAATANPSVFYDSPVDSGYSLDNLAPGIPSNFVYVAGALSWNKSSAADFDYFSVYGGEVNSFASATLINYTTGGAFDVSASPHNYYWVTATDFSGNEGKPALAHAASGVGNTPGQYVLSVSAYPNPFNPQTTVRYTLPAKTHVSLEIFDLRGEKVATLVDLDQNAGAFTTTWLGRNDAGAAVGSGVYFAKLSTASGVRTYKLVLLK